MNQRIIWRPNSFSVEEWDRLSREEQIRWWNDREPKPGLSLHPLEVAELYERGVVTKLEVGTFVFLRLTNENVHEFLERFPADLLTEVQCHADRLPEDHDDKAWGELVFFVAACYSPWVTSEEIQQADAERDRTYRQGVRVFREAMARRNTEN